jgi:hypothetical protein
LSSTVPAALDNIGRVAIDSILVWFIIPKVSLQTHFETEQACGLVRFPGDYVEGVTPVPIPNTVVKPLGADDTETSRESRTLPGFCPVFSKEKTGLFSFQRSPIFLIMLRAGRPEFHLEHGR